MYGSTRLANVTVMGHDYSPNIESLNMDAWSDGQMRSKIWLCEKIEADFFNFESALDIWIMGSWYGLLAQFLLIRNRLPIKRIKLFDVDSEALRISKKMLNMWQLDNRILIEHHQIDCTQIPENFWNDKPDIIINTSTEHFQNEQWLNFPKGIHFYAQSTNMDHPTHINRPLDLKDFKKKLEHVSQIKSCQKLEFKYPGFEFDRYMISGIR